MCALAKYLKKKCSNRLAISGRMSAAMLLILIMCRNTYGGISSCLFINDIEAELVVANDAIAYT